VQHVRDSAGELIHETTAKGRTEVRVRETTSWATYLARGVGSIGGALIIAGVVPFLVFFMLNAREKLYTAFKALAGNRLDVDALLLKVKDLVIGYAFGNILIGGLLSVASILVFWKVGLTPAVALGIVSGLLNLIPFVGLVLAVAVPVVAGLVQFHSTAQFLVVIVAVSVLHLVAANLLLPRFVGSRLDVGPVAATVGLLFWGWLWGIPGILLAVPLTATLKLVADSNPALAHLSNVLARNPRRSLRRKAGQPETVIRPAMRKAG
jgi:predicted PurR-regulated permease PerM